MKLSDDTLRRTLADAGIHIADDALSSSLSSGLPWYIRLAMAFTGWLAALFLFGFLAITVEFILDDASTSLLTSGVLIGVAYALLRAPRNDFTEHLGLAVSLVGQGLFAWAMVQLSLRQHFWWPLTLFELSLALWVPNTIHRFISSGVAGVSLAMALGTAGLSFLSVPLLFFAVAVLWLHEFSWPRYLSAIRALGYGLVVALIGLQGEGIVGAGLMAWLNVPLWSGLWLWHISADVMMVTILVYVVWGLMAAQAEVVRKPVRVAAILGAVVLGALSLKAPGICVGVAVILLGFGRSNTVLLGLGVASLLFYVSSYYYFLDVTLAAKAGSLLGVGLVLLSGYAVVLRVLPRIGGKAHA